MGEDKSRKQTEQTALADAKKKAIEQVSTYIKSETHVKNFELEKDLTSAYANAVVKVIQETGQGWYKDSAAGDCYKVKIKAEVIPDEKAMKNVSNGTVDEPDAPLNVKLWTDRKEYKQGDKIKIYLKGNKPFFARVVYKDAGGNLIQLLPNPYCENNYFNGGVIYELPSGNDKFDLEVSPPFGIENIKIYSSTSQLGDINLKADGGVYQVTTKAKDISSKTRGVVLKEKEADKEKKIPAEFSETGTIINTEK